MHTFNDQEIKNYFDFVDYIRKNKQEAYFPLRMQSVLKEARLENGDVKDLEDGCRNPDLGFAKANDTGEDNIPSKPLSEFQAR